MMIKMLIFCVSKSNKMNKIFLYSFCIASIHLCSYFILDIGFPFNQVSGQGYHKSLAGNMSIVHNTSFKCDNQDNCNMYISEVSKMNTVNQVCLDVKISDPLYRYLFIGGFLAEIFVILPLTIIGIARTQNVCATYVPDKILIGLLTIDGLFIQGVLIAYSVTKWNSLVMPSLLIALIMTAFMLYDFRRHLVKKDYVKI